MIFSAFTSVTELNKFGASCKIVADINAIKQVAVESSGSNNDGKELKPGVYGIGALAIGKLKNQDRNRND